MRARTSTSAAVVLLALLAGGCGEEDSRSSADATSATPEDEVRAFAEDFLDAFRTGDPSICDRMTPRYLREQKSADSDIGNCEEAVATIASWRDEDPEEWERDFGGPVREVRVDGDRASFLYGDEGDGNAILLVRDGDDWLIDGDDGEYSFKASLTTPEDEERWRRVVCDLEKGMTRDEVIDLMGQPTIIDAADFYWHGPADDSEEYFAVFGDDGKVTEYSTGGLCRH